MENKMMLYGIGGLVVGVLLTVFVASMAVNSNNQGMMRMMGMDISTTRTVVSEKDESKTMKGMGMDSSMDEMKGSLEHKTGDQFDQAFLSAMIVHHEGAIEMAKLAKTKALHQEVIDMAEDIISAQAREVETMRGWQSQWGY